MLAVGKWRITSSVSDIGELKPVVGSLVGETRDLPVDRLSVRIGRAEDANQTIIGFVGKATQEGSYIIAISISIADCNFCDIGGCGAVELYVSSPRVYYFIGKGSVEVPLSREAAEAAGVTLITLWPRITLSTLIPLRAGVSLIALCSLRASLASFTLVSLRPVITLRPLVSLGP